MLPAHARGKALPSPPTWHSHGAGLIRRAPNPKLAVAVNTPALDPAAGHDGARMAPAQGYGGSGDTCREGG